jgi:hypothetical protein
MYVVGYPRSGNTWLCYLLAYCLNAEYDDLDDPGVHPRSEAQRRYVKGGLGHASYQAQVGRVLKTHALHLSGQQREPVIYLARDGRDVMVSYFFYQYGFARQTPTQVGQQETARRILGALSVRRLTRRLHNPSFSSFVRRHASEWAYHVRAWLGRDPAAIVRYEDLHSDTEATLADLLASLQVQPAPDVLRQAVELFTFGQLSGRQPGQENAGSFFRKGIVGDWRNHFSKADGVYFARVAGEILECLGYAAQERMEQ